MSTQNAVNAALYTKLTGGTALTALLSGTAAVYFLQAPDEEALPFVVFSQQAGITENITRSDMRNLVYYVRGYAASPALAGSIDAQVSTLLHHGTAAVSGYNTFWMARETDISLVENLPDGTRVYVAGAMYRIRLDD